MRVIIYAMEVDVMTLTPKKLASNNRYLKNQYEIVSIRTRRDEHWNEILEDAAHRHGISKRQDIMTALRDALESDGIRISSNEQCE